LIVTGVQTCALPIWRRSCLRPPRRERLIEKSLAEDEGLADNLKSLLATSGHVHARATLNAVEPKGEATMMCGKSRRAGFALLTQIGRASCRERVVMA